MGRDALYLLLNNSFIIIKEADKGLVLVVWVEKTI